MKDQINTVREALEGADRNYTKALTALSEIERMAGEPVADINVRPSESGGTIASVFSHKLPVGSWLVYRATPPAQQPHERVAVTWDKDHTRILAVTLQDAEGRVLCVIDEAPAQQPQAKPHKPLFADLIAQHPGLREELLEMDKQPQAEKRCQYCDGTGDVHSIDGQWRGECHCQKQPQAEAVRINYFPVYELAHKHKLLYNEVCAVVRAAMSAPQQAEAVPPGYVAAKSFRWDGEKQQHIPQLTLEFEPVPANSPCDAQGWKDRDAVAQMFDAAIAQQKGGV